MARQKNSAEALPDPATPAVTTPVEEAKEPVTESAEAQVETPAIETPAAETPVEPVAEQPKVFAHTQRMLALAGRYQINPHVAAAMSPAELQQEIGERQLEAREQAIEQLVRPKAPATPEPEPEIDLGINEADFAPEVVTALKGIAKRAAAAEKKAQQLETEHKQFREQQTVQSFRAQVDPVFEKLGLGDAKPGSPAQAKQNAILHYLSTLQASGQHPGPPEVAIPMANAILFGGSAQPAPAPAPKATNGKTPTPTARPTSRLGAHDDNNSLDSITQRLQAYMDAQAESMNRDANGEFVP